MEDPTLRNESSVNDEASLGQNEEENAAWFELLRVEDEMEAAPKPLPITNIGNTCFVNAGIQVRTKY